MTPAASSGMLGAVSKRDHQNATGATSSAAAASEIASSARGVSIGSAGRNLSTSATITINANAATSQTSAYDRKSERISMTESG
jgi:hypothetical protein